VNVPSPARAALLVIAIALPAMPSALQAATAAYQAAIEASAPVLYYQFNEGSGAAVNHGSLGAGYDATYFGAPTRGAPTLAVGARWSTARRSCLSCTSSSPPAR